MKIHVRALIASIITLAMLPFLVIVFGWLVINFIGPLLLFSFAAFFVWIFYMLWCNYFDEKDRNRVER